MNEMRMRILAKTLAAIAQTIKTENGNALFFDDIYGHDQRLEAALNSRRPKIVPAT